MSKKTIYVRSEDESIFEQALSLFGEDNVSRLIVDALKAYVEAKQAEEEVTLEVGTWPAKGADETHKIAFKGRLLAEATTYLGQTSSNDARGRIGSFTKQRRVNISYGGGTGRWEKESTTADYTVLEELPPAHVIFRRVLYDVSSCRGLIEEAAAAWGKDITQHLDI